MIEVFGEQGKFYNDWIDNPSPVILFGIGKEGKIWLEKIISLGIQIDAIIDSYFKGNYKHYEVKELNSLVKSQDYMILITVNSRIKQYQMIQALRAQEIIGRVYIEKSFKEYDFRVPKGDLVESIPWFYKSAYQSNVGKQEIREWNPEVPLLLSPTGYFYKANYASRDVNCRDKCRKTVETPDNFQNSIYMFGDSRVYGVYLKDEDTIPSKLQKLINSTGKKNKVFNCSVNGNNLNNVWLWMQDISLDSSDVVIISCLNFTVRKSDWDFDESGILDGVLLCMDYLKKIKKKCEDCKAELYVVILGTCQDVIQKRLSEVYIVEAARKAPFWNKDEIQLPINFDYLQEMCDFENINVLDYRKVINRTHIYGDIFIDSWHFSPNGTAMIANALVEDVINEKHKRGNNELRLRYLRVADEMSKWRVFPFIESKEYKDYLDELKCNKVNGYKIVGAIVMNANPFTNGHEYLVKTAAKQVDWLYVLVVEEDKSEFSFSDRLEMVCRGTENIKNVSVLRSGEFVISSFTFPDYFQNTKMGEGGGKDLNVFVHLIAPVLDIKIRFVGTEPFSEITRDYNELMKKILPEYGIKCIEIERCSDSEGHIVSATEVRRNLLCKNFDAVRSLVPKTTYDYLMEKAGKKKESRI